MASSSSERLPMTTASTKSAITSGSRVLGNPIKEAAFADESIPSTDLIASIGKLESDDDELQQEKALQDGNLITHVPKLESDGEKSMDRAAALADSMAKLAVSDELHEKVLRDDDIGFTRAASSTPSFINAVDQPRLLWDVKEANKEREKTLLYPTVGNKSSNKRQKIESVSPQELPKISRDVTAEMDDKGRLPSTTFFYNFRVGSPCLLWEVSEKEPDAELATKNWKPRGGPVRNQFDHDNCWSYSATDVYSCYRLETGEVNEFLTMSAIYLTFYASQEERNRKRSKEEKREGHLCHGFPVKRALEFIQKEGVPVENREDATRYYSCIKDPPARKQDVFKFGADVRFQESDRIQDLYQMLLHQAVSANLVLYHPEYRNTRSLDQVYEGPTSVGSVFRGVHATLVLAIVKVNGKWAALVKLSHGSEAGAEGYMHVSLTKMIMAVKYSALANQISQIKDDENEPLAEPSYLLRNFTGVDYGKSVAAAGTDQKKRKST